MNADEYKQTKQQALNYGLLLFTKRQLEKASETLLIRRIEDIIQNNKLPFPEKHEMQNELYAGFYRIDLNQIEIEKIISALFDKAAEVSQAEESPASYASAVDAWYELISYRLTKMPLQTKRDT